MQFGGIRIRLTEVRKMLKIIRICTLVRIRMFESKSVMGVDRRDTFERIRMCKLAESEHGIWAESD